MIKKYLQKFFIKQVIYMLGNASDKNLVRIAGILKKIAPNDAKTIEAVKQMVIEKHPAVELIRRILRTNKKCREKLVVNLVINGLLLNGKKRDIAAAKGEAVPFTVLISPTMRCNLDCIGCYAGNYSKKDDMFFETLDRIIKEGKEMGTAVFTFLGGEPFVYSDLFKILKKHNDAYFQIYTNSTMLNKSAIDKLEELGNAMPIISIEGWEKETDTRRGKGVYKKILQVTKMLREKKMPFGFSVAVTNKNVNVVMSDKFMDFLVKEGGLLCWFFLYMPVGKKPDLKLMPTPEQRLMMLKRDKKIRATKPIFIVDFWNDAPYVGGCIAGSKYVHITSKGDVEPCIFTHFAMDNIKNKSLKEVMNSAYFKELRKRQPYNENLYLPCQWIDNPEVSRELGKKFKIYPTHPGSDDILTKPKIKKGIDEYSKKVKKLYKKVWEEKKKEDA